MEFLRKQNPSTRYFPLLVDFLKMFSFHVEGQAPLHIRLTIEHMSYTFDESVMQ